MAALDPDRHPIAPMDATAASSNATPPSDELPPDVRPVFRKGDGSQAGNMPPRRSTSQHQPDRQTRPLQRARPIAPAEPVGQDQSIPRAEPLETPSAVASGRLADSAESGKLRSIQGGVPSRAGRAETQQDEMLENETDEERDLGELAVRYAPPWLISAVFHMGLMIILAMMLLPSIVQNHLNLTAIYAETLGDQLVFDLPWAGNDETMIEEPIVTPDDLEQVENPFAAPPQFDVFFPHATIAVSGVDATQIGMALRGRSEGTRQSLLAAYGGNATTEGAVQLGLAWLAKYQKRNGSWSLTGSYSHGAVDENAPAATAMALLAFQGNGHTHKQGDYAQNVSRAWAWLIKELDADGSFFHRGYYAHRFYTQGMCTIALCELYGMSQDEKFKEPAQRAVRYCLKTQGSGGGWRYAPGENPSDASVTGWILMALQSARMAGLEVPADDFLRAGRFLDRVASDGGSRYAYQRGDQVTRTITAEALLCRQYLGWERDDPRLVEGVQWITQPENLIDYQKDRNVYYWYYATQLTHHMEGESWQRWNEVMRQAVPQQQVKSGREAGSWDPLKPKSDEWGDHGGRLFVTCLSIYMLEVYYRHLPLYSSPFGRVQGF